MMLWLGLLACSGVAEPVAVEAAAPPLFVWEGAHQVDGRELRFAARLPPSPGRQVTVYASLARLQLGACAPGVIGACVQLQAPVVLGVVLADPTGLIQLRRPWPAALAGQTRFEVQGVVGDPGGVVRGVSPVWSYTIHPADADADGDGLGNGAEWDAGTRLDRFDTDGGGVADAQELLVDQTNPRRPGDDVGRENSCDNGIDDDSDGGADCQDGDCGGAGLCGEWDCRDGADVDHNGLVDCADPWCDLDDACPEDCANGLDDDGDGRVDCADRGCGEIARCVEGDCADGFDGADRDGLRDCADPDCQTPGACPERACADGVDDDGDALVDCEDADCAFGPACAELACSDGADDDHDGQIDCDDDDCWTADCHTSTVAWTLEGAFQIRTADGFEMTMTASAVRGRVRVEGPRVGVQSCSWSVDHAMGAYVPWLATGTSGARTGFEITPGCEVGPEVLPPVTLALWQAFAWYAPTNRHANRPAEWPYALWFAGTDFGGPFLRPEPFGTCPGGVAPTIAYVDADGDGYGVQEVRDMHSALGGRRYVCGPVPAGMTLRGGDCDDGDATWSPATVVPAWGVTCEQLSPNDRDGDGVLAPVDRDDESALVR